MIKVAVCGAGGKMGSMLTALVSKDKRFKLVGATEIPGHPLVGRLLPGGSPVTSRLEELLPKTDVVIDFTQVGSTLRHAKACGKAGVRMVIGTTGWNASTSASLKKLLKKTPYVISPNMSLAVNLLFRLTNEAASGLASYDAEIVEIHHNQKKDAPEFDRWHGHS